MFVVNLNNEEDKEYYAFDEGELYQIRLISANNTFSIDNRLLKVVSIKPAEGLAQISFVNICPVLVEAKDFNNHLNQYRYSTPDELLNLIPIEKKDYEMLEVLSNYQHKDYNEKRKKEQIREATFKSRQYVKKYLDPNYKYKSY